MTAATTARTATTAAPTGAATTTAAAAEAAATAALLTLLGFVHFDLAPIEHLPVELGDGFGRGLGVAHCHEREATGLPGLTIRGNHHLANLAYCSERGLDARLGGTKRQISDKKTIAHSYLRGLFARSLKTLLRPPDEAVQIGRLDATRWNDLGCTPEPASISRTVMTFRTTHIFRKTGDMPSKAR
jgi:hypothetical protein